VVKILKIETTIDFWLGDCVAGVESWRSARESILISARVAGEDSPVAGLDLFANVPAKKFARNMWTARI